MILEDDDTGRGPAVEELDQFEIDRAVALGEAEGEAHVVALAARKFDACDERRAELQDARARLAGQEADCREAEAYHRPLAARRQASLATRRLPGLGPGGPLVARAGYALQMAFGAALAAAGPLLDSVSLLTLLFLGKAHVLSEAATLNQYAFVSSMSLAVVVALESLSHMTRPTWRPRLRGLVLATSVGATAVACPLFAAEMARNVEMPALGEAPPASLAHWLILAQVLANAGVSHFGIWMFLAGRAGLFSDRVEFTEAHLGDRAKYDESREHLNALRFAKALTEERIRALEDDREAYITVSRRRFRLALRLYQARLRAHTAGVESRLLSDTCASGPPVIPAHPSRNGHAAPATAEV